MVKTSSSFVLETKKKNIGKTFVHKKLGIEKVICRGKKRTIVLACAFRRFKITIFLFQKRKRRRKSRQSWVNDASLWSFLGRRLYGNDVVDDPVLLQGAHWSFNNNKEKESSSNKAWVEKPNYAHPRGTRKPGHLRRERERTNTFQPPVTRWL